MYHVKMKLASSAGIISHLYAETAEYSQLNLSLWHGIHYAGLYLCFIWFLQLLDWERNSLKCR